MTIICSCCLLDPAQWGSSGACEESGVSSMTVIKAYSHPDGALGKWAGSLQKTLLIAWVSSSPNNHLITTVSWHWCTSKFPSNCRTKQYFVFTRSHNHLICEFLKSSNELSARQLLSKAFHSEFQPFQMQGWMLGCPRLIWLGGQCPAATPALPSGHSLLGHAELLKGLISHHVSFSFQLLLKMPFWQCPRKFLEIFTGSLDFSFSTWVLINPLLLPSWMLGSSAGLQLLRLQHLP